MLISDDDTRTMISSFILIAGNKILKWRKSSTAIIGQKFDYFLFFFRCFAAWKLSWLLRRGLFLECRVTHKNKNWRRCGLNCPFTQAIKDLDKIMKKIMVMMIHIKSLEKDTFDFLQCWQNHLGLLLESVWGNKLAPKFRKLAATLLI